MISKAKACPGGTALFNYVVNDKKGYELLRKNLSGLTPKDMYSNMNIIQQQNSRCTNNTISVVLSPSIKDGKRLDPEFLRKITADFLKEMKLDHDKSQYLAFVHTEKAHKHIHILLNRVKNDGSLIKDGRISTRAQKIAHLIAKKYNLISAKEIKEEREKRELNSNKAIKKHMRSINYKVLLRKPKNLKEYIEMMKSNGITVMPTINRQGNIQGYRFLHEESGTNLKASEVDRSLKLNKMFESRPILPDIGQTHTQSSKSENKHDTEIGYSPCKTNQSLVELWLNALQGQYQNDAENNEDKKRKRRNRRR